MSSVRAPQPNISVEDYLAGEQHAEVRHEYIHGQVYAMTGASDRHGLIVNAMAFALTAAARRKGCQLFSSDMKLRLELGGKTIFYYPDPVSYTHLDVYKRQEPYPNAHCHKASHLDAARQPGILRSNEYSRAQCCQQRLDRR